MADKTDLTFSELQAELPANALTYANGDITLSIGTLTGDTYTGLTNEGVVEAFYKLRVACQKAQTTVNEDLDEEDAPLTSFVPFTYNAPNADGNIVIAQTHTVSIPLSEGIVKGTT